MTKAEKHHHISSWELSGQSKKAYCLANGIKYATFLYWIRNSREEDTEVSTTKGEFIALAAPSINTGAELQLPNGIRICQAAASDIELIRLLYGI